MPGGFAPRFALEAGFLILLGVGAGIADLRPVVIVMLLVGGWVLVCLIELSAWRGERRAASITVPPPPPAVAEPEAEAELHGWPLDGASPFEPDDTAYPLRADAGSEPSEEIEAYTRVMGDEGGEHEDQAPDERAE